MSGPAFNPDEVLTGASYEADRGAIRARLAASAAGRRVPLGDDIVLVFETRATISAALAELIRSERVDDPDSVAAEVRAFASLLPEAGELAATLYVDQADPVALTDRLAELGGVGGAVALEVAGSPVPARSDPEDDLSGAFHIVFTPTQTQRRALAQGSTTRLVIDHPGCRLSAALTEDQARAIAADLQG